MSLRLFCLYFFVLLFSDSLKAEDLTNNIELALTRGDFFSSYRAGLAFEESDEEKFIKTGIDGYLKSLFVVGSSKQIQSECVRLTKKTHKAAYLCGLYYLENSLTDTANKFLDRIDNKTNFYYPAQILKASSAIIEHDFNKALKLLTLDHIEKYKELQLEQLFYLTRARALIGLNLFEEATKYSQSVESKTPYYIEALEQTAWIFFKSRKFESAQILLDVIISTFESPQKIEGDLKISSTLYYKARYLKAYLALLEQRPEGAANEFSQLKGDYDKFLLSFKKEKFEAEFKKLQQDPVVSSEIKTYSPLISSRLTFAQDWLGAEVGADLAKEIKLQAAINNEILRIKKLESTDSNNLYLSNLEKLKSKSFTFVINKYGLTVDKLNQAMSTLSLKCELGRLDVFWLNRAQGARNLEEVIDNYKQATKSIENYVDL